LPAPETTLLRAPPGARMTTPLCRIAQEMAGQQGWRRYGLAFLLGALLAAGLPPVDLTPVVFVVFPLYLWLDDGSATPLASARLAYVFALGHFTAGLYWIAAALFVDIGTFWWALPFALLGTPAVLSCFVAVCLYAVALAKSKLKLSGIAAISLFAVAWSASEWLRGHLFTGFPWDLIGYVWAGAFPGAVAMLQSTAVIGIYGLSFLTVLAAALLSLLGTASLAPLSSWRRTMPAIAAAALKWDPAAAEANFRRLTELSTAPSPHKLAAVIWPEAAATFFLERDAVHRAEIATVAPEGGYVITGALRAEPLVGPVDQVWNSIEVIDASAKIVARFDKAHLVPFGEYMPLKDVLPLKKFSPGTIDLSAGPGPQTLTLARLPSFSPLICYEAIFPGAVVDPHDRPDWLLNVSNDAWYGRSAGPYQHFAIARTRAVEEGLPLVRVANNGITGVVDAEGRVLARTSLDAVTYADIALPAAGAATPYSYFGDGVFLAMLAVVAVIALIPAVRQRMV
jgi:apolipoprotein N-acyltransferase